MHNNILPVGALTNWSSKTRPLHCTKNIASWLYDHSSLTKKLELKFNSFSVDIKQQINIKPNALLSHYFDNENSILVREVFLRCNNQAVVFAQTEIPSSTLTEKQTALAQIGKQALGKILFQDPSMLRGKIEASEFKVGSAIHQFVAEIGQPVTHSLWARRSLFYINNKPLLVSELFLPASGIYDN